MDIKFIIQIAIPIVIAIYATGFFTEILIDFDAVKKYPENSNKISSITLENTGFLQAKEVIAHIPFDSEITISDTNCLEGNISHNQDIVSISFERMSIDVFCTIDFPKSSNYNTTGIIITSDNHSPAYPESDYKINNLLLIIILIILFVVEPIVVVSTLRITYNMFPIFFAWHHEKIPKWKEIRNTIKHTHNIKVDSYDVSILYSIFKGYHTYSEINARTKITKTYVKKRISFFQKNDIMLLDKIELHNSVKKSIREFYSDHA